jgi:hypothetical protein
MTTARLFGIGFALALILATAAPAATLEARAHQQRLTLHAARGTLIFFRNHPRVRWQHSTRSIATRELRRARSRIRTASAMLARLEARMQPVWPAHHALWGCIHGHEAADWHNGDTGGNGHYGGLQMHPGWGYGTSYLASSDSQLTQERAAEAGYRASGFSRAWLLGQWYHPDCLAYA